MVAKLGFVGQADERSSEDVRVKAGTCSTPFSTAETSRIRTRGNFPGDSSQPGGRCIGKLWFKEGHQVYRLCIPCKPKSWKIHGRVSTIGFSKTCRYITGKYCRYPGFGAISLIFASTWLLKTQPGHFHHAGLLNVRCSAICHLLLAQNMLNPLNS